MNAEKFIFMSDWECLWASAVLLQDDDSDRGGKSEGGAGGRGGGEALSHNEGVPAQCRSLLGKYSESHRLEMLMQSQRFMQLLFCGLSQ